MGNVCATSKSVKSRPPHAEDHEAPPAPRNAEYPVLKGIPQWEYDVNEGGSPAIDISKNAGNVSSWLDEVDSLNATTETIQYLSPQAREDPPSATALTIEWLPSRYDATAVPEPHTEQRRVVSALDLRTPLTTKRPPPGLFAVYGRKH